MAVNVKIGCHIVLALPPHIKNKSLISRKNHDKDTNFGMKNNRR